MGLDQITTQIIHFRIERLDQPDLPRAMPGFQLLFSHDGAVHRLMLFEKDKIEATIFACEHTTCTSLVFPDSLPKVRSDTDIERRSLLVAHNVNVADFHVPSNVMLSEQCCDSRFLV